MVEPLKINKPIRLIELFAGIGSQAKALERLGANFEHYRICEFDKYAIKSYNAIHGTDFATSDITQISASDLGIVDTDKYCYIVTYSFPCQDLSLAGKGRGMAKGDNTRSGLLWEVERLLNECDELPQILLMENVTQVHGKKNKEHFDEWIAFLESKGYSNFWKDLNAKNFGIPQNRNRCFMVSVLGDYKYEFPKEFPLELRLKDMLEAEVDEKFYLSDIAIQGRMQSNFRQYNLERSLINEKEIHPAVLARYEGAPTLLKEPKVIGGGIGEKKSNGGTQWYQQDRVYEGDVAISVTTAFNPYYAVQKDEIIDPFICASRGRNPENPSDRRSGIHLEQRLEPNFSGCTNTITTVQKDNYVAEPIINKIDIPQTVRVRKYDVDCTKLCEVLRDSKSSSGLNNQDIATHLDVPLTKVEHWFRQDKYFAIPDENIWFELKALLGIGTNEFDESIIAFEEREGVFEKSNRCYFPDGLAPTITSASANEKVVEPTINVVGNYSPSNHDASRIVASNGLAPTVKENHGTVTAIIVPTNNKKGYDEAIEGDSINLEQPNSTTRRGRVGHGVAQTLNTSPQQAVVENVRIRKLTPKECWRLMGFDDADFENASTVNSNSQLYKQAGNSIVVDVLCCIFREML